MLRILIADDHDIVRRGMKQILLEEFSFAHIGEAIDTDSLIAKAINEKWDIVVSDLAMPGGGGLLALRTILEKVPGLPVLFFSTYPEEQYALRVIKAGAAGYLNKNVATEELPKAVRQILSGKKYTSAGIAEKLGLPQKDFTETTLHELLSERELSIFIMIAAGQSISEIASKLDLATTTISTYRSRILTKMNLRTNAELTQYAIEHKFI
jgi:two-component system invasion response regulator UvrY